MPAVQIQIKFRAAKDCQVGEDAVWPVIGDVRIWRIISVDAEAVIARDVKNPTDYLVMSAARPVAVVDKVAPQPQPRQYYGGGYAQATNASAGGAFGAFWGAGGAFGSPGGASTRSGNSW